MSTKHKILIASIVLGATMGAFLIGFAPLSTWGLMGVVWGAVLFGVMSFTGLSSILLSERFRWLFAVKTDYKSYQRLDFLRQQDIDFVYTPFDQGATTGILNPEWLGQCNEFTHSWLWAKVCANDLKEVSTYKITNPHLPHPLIMGDNMELPAKIQQDLEQNFIYSVMGQYDIDEHHMAPSSSEEYKRRYIELQKIYYGILDSNYIVKDSYPKLDVKIDNLLEFIERKRIHYGVICAEIIVYGKESDLPPFKHVIAFAKRDNSISLFDPNYGEITFYQLSDFKRWFKKEVKEGVLKYIFHMRRNDPEKNYNTLADIFPQPHFTQEQLGNPNPIAQQIIKRRQGAQQSRSRVNRFFVTDYQVHSYFPNESDEATAHTENRMKV